MDRPTRRDFKRATGDRYPDDVWKIVIGSTSDEEGNGTGFCRTYSGRWRVRGHWRRLNPEQKPGPGPEAMPRRDADRCWLVWIDPYVKGPAGASWLRPLHPVRELRRD